MGPDAHREWLETPLMVEVGSERFLAKRAAPWEHEPFYDLVDLAFGEKRSRAAYDWMYRRNPAGHARTWLLFDRSSGRLVSGESSFPWAIAKGPRTLRGEMVGDSVTHPEFRNQGLGALRLAAREAHPWRAETMAVGAPNFRSRSLIHKLKRNDALIGPFASGAIVLRPDELLQERGWPAALARSAALPARALFRAWRGLAFRDGATRVERVDRFDGAFDAVTQRCMASPGFWCPHDAAFLNWRYLDHPELSHVALAAVEEERPVAYAVVQLDGRAATLMDFAAPLMPRAVAPALLGRSVEAARAAGCHHLRFFAPPAWRHWPLFRRCGFLPAPREQWILARGYGMADAHELRNWQLMPGDRA